MSPSLIFVASYQLISIPCGGSGDKNVAFERTLLSGCYGMSAILLSCCYSVAWQLMTYLQHPAKLLAGLNSSDFQWWIQQTHWYSSKIAGLSAGRHGVHSSIPGPGPKPGRVGVRFLYKLAQPPKTFISYSLLSVAR